MIIVVLSLYEHFQLRHLHSSAKSNLNLLDAGKRLHFFFIYVYNNTFAEDKTRISHYSKIVNYFWTMSMWRLTPVLFSHPTFFFISDPIFFKSDPTSYLWAYFLFVSEKQFFANLSARINLTRFILNDQTFFLIVTDFFWFFFFKVALLFGLFYLKCP